MTDAPAALPLTRRDLLAMTGAAAVAAAAPAHAAAPDLAGPWTGLGEVATIGGVIHYATLGPASGTPLVLLPKLGGWTADWRHAAPMLAKTRRVIAIDPPGHGGSAMAGRPPYIVSVPECTAMILAALDDIGVERFAIAGNSLGGIIGAVAAATSPDRVDRLVIVSSSLIGAMSRADILAQDKRNADPHGPSSYAPDGRPLRSTPEQVKAFGTLDHRITEEMEISRRQAGLWVRPCERGVGRVGVTDYLPRIAAPTLLIYTDSGRYAKYADVGVKLIPKARAAIIRGSGSFVHQEKPAETAAAMNRFLDEPAG